MNHVAASQVIDDFLENPHAMRDFALSQEFLYKGNVPPYSAQK
jgi:hypothetical protein